MDFDFLHIMEQYGYIGLFLWLWLGVFGLPIPNEVIVMTVALGASLGSLHPDIAFMVTYAGMVSALTTCYFVGKWVGQPLLPKLKRSRRMARIIKRSFVVIERHHAVSLLFSYFVPGLRNFVPFLYGLSRFSYRSFATYAYTGAFIWLTLMFSIGYWFGDHIDLVIKYEQEFLLSLLVVLSFYLGLKWVLKRKTKKMRRSEL